MIGNTSRITFGSFSNSIFFFLQKDFHIKDGTHTGMPQSGFLKIFFQMGTEGPSFDTRKAIPLHSKRQQTGRKLLHDRDIREVLILMRDISGSFFLNLYFFEGPKTCPITSYSLFAWSKTTAPRKLNLFVLVIS